MRWGHASEIGVYAQHVYTTLNERETVLEYLEYKAEKGTTDQQILAVAGSLLFRDEHVKKKVGVLSGGERARLCMAGLLLGSYNILVLDEPGNHLDVETVEALAEALLAYRGTVIFTSHDRHFMKRIATNIIEVRDGGVKNYLGDYDAYLYSMNQEIEQGNRDTSAGKSNRQKTAGKQEMTKEERIASQQDHKRRRKQLQALERKIARLDDQKKALNAELMTETDPEKAVSIHEEVTKLVQELSDAENQWLDLSQLE